MALKHKPAPGMAKRTDSGLPESAAGSRQKRGAAKPAKPGRPAPAPSSAKWNAAKIGGITITHPARVIFPGTNVTKARLAEYYLAVADHILPHVKNRPLSLMRCPEGMGGGCFFQRHVAFRRSPYLHDAAIRTAGGSERYLTIRDIEGLITLVQYGVIELHPWGCLADKPNLPDRIVFDLDPDPAIPWSYVIEGASEIRERMQELGLESFVKTTGGKGLHVVIPMQRSYRWEVMTAFARALAESMQRDSPRRYVAKAAKEARKGRIFVDYLRNEQAASAVAPYSARAREGAPIAMPVAWEELKPALKLSSFTVENAPELLGRRKRNPWADFFKVRQKISASYLRALKIAPL
jgi:bifunctional non-homologous end joining protein LigD